MIQSTKLLPAASIKTERVLQTRHTSGPSITKPYSPDPEQRGFKTGPQDQLENVHDAHANLHSSPRSSLECQFRSLISIHSHSIHRHQNHNLAKRGLRWPEVISVLILGKRLSMILSDENHVTSTFAGSYWLSRRPHQRRAPRLEYMCAWTGAL